jgi:hypothetical protein
MRKSEKRSRSATYASQPQEECPLLHPLQGVSCLSTPLQGGILKPPALRVVDLTTRHHTIKRDKLKWTKRGVHLLLQTRVKTLNQELGAVFQRWYPDLQLEEEPLAA